MAPVFAKHWNLPFGNAISDKYFGSNKTYRGFIYGIIAAMITVFIQFWLIDIPYFKTLSILDYSKNPLLLGLTMGFGALFGDLVKSFFKRRMGRPPGSPFVPFDQVDFIIGGLIFLWFLQPISEDIVLFLLIVTPFLHFLTNVLGYILRIKDRWW